VPELLQKEQKMTNRFINPRPQFTLADGSVLPLGEMAFFENGTDVDKDTFSDVNEKNKNANPLKLFADGSMPNCFYAGTARTILTFDDGSGRQQRFDVDGVGQFGSGAAFDIWNSIVEYESGALVEGSDGEYYRSLQNNNTGNDPVSSATFWEQVSFLRTWNENITYALGDGGVVGSDGKIYASLQASNLNNDPVSSPTFWAVNNPFDQDLNTTDDPTFDVITGTGIADFSAAGIHLGGVASDNNLDDYEEGSWTPVVADAASGGNTGTATVRGRYVKVGAMVTVWGEAVDIDTTGLTAGNNFFIQGLPFAASEDGYGVTRSNNVTLGNDGLFGEITAAQSAVRFRENRTATTNANIIVSALTSTTADFYITITYRTNL